MKTTSIPYREREAIFLRHAATIGAILSMFPQSVSLSVPSNITADTFRHQLWDAINAKRKRGWRSDLVDDALFADHASQVQLVILNEKTVVATNKQALDSRKVDCVQISPFDPKASTKPIIHVLSNDPSLINAACALLASKQLEPAVSFSFVLTEEQAESIRQSPFDVWLEKDETIGHNVYVVT